MSTAEVAYLSLGIELAFLLGVYALLKWSDRRVERKRQEDLTRAEWARAFPPLSSTVRGVRAAPLWPGRSAFENFPAPRETDCAHGCCHAGDEGLSSEVPVEQLRKARGLGEGSE